jgi:hypothetical protein
MKIDLIEVLQYSDKKTIICILPSSDNIYNNITNLLSKVGVTNSNEIHTIHLYENYTTHSIHKQLKIVLSQNEKELISCRYLTHSTAYTFAKDISQYDKIILDSNLIHYVVGIVFNKLDLIK